MKRLTAKYAMLSRKTMKKDAGAEKSRKPMSSYVSSNNSPVFVCCRCGGILRVLFYSNGDKIQCRYCGDMMIKTDYKLSDDEGYLMYGNDKESYEFQNKLFKEYVKDSGKFSNEEHSMRISQIKHIKGKK